MRALQPMPTVTSSSATVCYQFVAIPHLSRHAPHTRSMTCALRQALSTRTLHSHLLSPTHHSPPATPTRSHPSVHTPPITCAYHLSASPVLVSGCESGDLMTPAPDEPEVLLPRALGGGVAIDDLIVVEGSGAYCSSMSTKNYNR